MRSNRRLAAALLVMASLLASVATVEVVLRFTPYTDRLTRFDTYFPRYYFRPDPLTGYDIAEGFQATEARVPGEGVRYQIWANELGCFDTPYAEGTPYLLLLGDSFTHAWAAFEAKWGTRLEALLGMRVLKCGVAGFGTHQAWLKAERLLARRENPPRLIVLGYFSNDLEDDYLFPGRMVMLGYLGTQRVLADQRTGTVTDTGITEADVIRMLTFCRSDRNSWAARIKCALAQRSILYVLLRDAYWRLEEVAAPAPLGPASPAANPRPAGQADIAFLPVADAAWLHAAWAAHLANLAGLQALAQRVGAPLLVVHIPGKPQLAPTPTAAGGPDWDQPYRLIGAFTARHAIAYLDLLPAFRAAAQRGHSLYYRYDGHWNVQGNHLAALHVAEYILTSGLIVLDDAPAKLRRVRAERRSFGD